MSRIAREIVEAVLLALVVFLLLQSTVRNFKVDGSSMFPTLEEGNYLLVNRLVPEAELGSTVGALLTQISEQSAPVLEMAKKVMYLSMGLPLQDAMKKSADLYLNHLMDLEDSQEGLRAILERRKPVWKNK